MGDARRRNFEDVDFILGVINRFQQMDFYEHVRHVTQNPADRDHQIDLPTGRSLYISADAAQRLYALAERLVRASPDCVDLDVQAIDRAIRIELVQTFVLDGKPLGQRWIDKMLSRSMRRARQDCLVITHYIQCTLGHNGLHDVTIGPVNLSNKGIFFGRYADAIALDYVKSVRRYREVIETIAPGGAGLVRLPSEDWESIDWIQKYYESADWIATVTVPACHPRVSRDRAELAVQAALDVLKLFFDSFDAQNLSLVIARAASNEVVNLYRTDDVGFAHSVRRHRPSVMFDWHQYAHLNQWYPHVLTAAGQAIVGYLDDRTSLDLANRWLGALNWYGQAVSETVVTAKIVKYVAALERLTITDTTATDNDRGLTDAVTRRTALLCSADDSVEAVTRARQAARRLYRYRSSLMHGRRAPVSKEQPISQELEDVVHEAHQLTRHVVVRALLEFEKLGFDAQSGDLEQRFRNLELAANLSDTP